MMVSTSLLSKVSVVITYNQRNLFDRAKFRKKTIYNISIPNRHITEVALCRDFTTIHVARITFPSSFANVVLY